jgi:hypothetical protein
MLVRIRPVKRTAYFILAGLSLLLCIASIVLWIRSHSTADAYRRNMAHGEAMLSSARGGLALTIITNPADGKSKVTPQPGFSSTPVSTSRPTIPPTWSFAGIRYTHFNFFGVIFWELLLPFWLVTALLLILPLGVPLAKRISHHRRARRGLCPHCGYDMRATPGRCPECGTART